MSNEEGSTAAKRVRVFLASPSDVGEERELAKRVADNLAGEARYRDAIQLQVVGWDQPGMQITMRAGETPQDSVADQLPLPSECDVAVVILWSRMGTPLPETQRKHDGGRFLSGTEWEYEDALQAFKKTGCPEVWVYRRDEEPQIGLKDLQREEKIEQWDRVEQFFDSMKNTDGSIADGVNPYKTPDEFATRFEKDLRSFLERVLSGNHKPSLPKAAKRNEPLSPAAQTLKQQLQNAEDPDGDLLDQVYSEPPATVEAYRLYRYACWARDREPLQKRFVNLHLLIDRGTDHEQARMELEQNRYDDLRELLAHHPDHPAWVLIGDPGCGKSTVLQHYELKLSQAGIAENTAELCVWQRLSEYGVDSADPQTWLEQRWRKIYPLMPPLAELKTQYRLRYILDGLNEIRHKSDADYAQVTRRWVAWAADLDTSAIAAPPLFSIRSLNYSVPLTRADFSPLFIKLERWQPEQIEQFIDSRGVPELWSQIRDDEKLLEFSGLPINLAQQCELYTELQRPARNRAELFGGLLWQRMKRAHELGELDADGLLSNADKRRLLNSAWRDSVLHPPAGGLLLNALGEQAASMHRLGAEISLPDEEVATHLPAEARDAWLAAVAQMNIIDLDDPSQFRFSHQSWQEYFAARGLAARQWTEDDPPIPDFSAPELKPLNDVLAELSVGDLLPGPGVSHWEESIKILLPLLNEQSLANWFEELIRQNPPLAARAGTPLIERLPEVLLDQLRTRLLAISRDADRDLRLRIEAGQALGDIGDRRYLRKTAADGTPYLVPLESHILTIPAGVYPVGGDDADAESDEKTAVGEVPRVAIETFEMSFAPVTNAEYRCFIDAGGYDDERWWVGDEAKAWQAGDNELTERIEFFRALFAELREAEDTDAVARRRVIGEPTSTTLERYREWAEWSESEAEDALQNSFGAKQHKAPFEWGNRSFNRPTQPVVGVCCFEAQAYCQWLSAVSGERWMLPTEAQWQAAAGGTEGRRWPWGPQPAGRAVPNDTMLNIHDTHLRASSPVGVFPESDTPARQSKANGLSDMAGNVLEWCDSDYSSSLDADKVHAKAAGGTRRVLRGGSFNLPAVSARCARRNGSAPGDRYGNSGFRLARGQ
jgi:formylglycine-generating enzyme required for sulfatase activity